MRARRLVALPLFLLALVPARAQQPPAFGETVEVRVVNLDVTVTDRDGNPVTGLTRDDFEVFESGKPKEITNFLEIDERPGTAAAAPATTRAERRVLVFFIDNTTLHPFNRNRVLTAMTELVKQTMRSNDVAVIVTWNPGLKNELDVTGNRESVVAALQALGTRLGGAPALERDREETREALRQQVLDMGVAPREPGSPPQKPPYAPALTTVLHYGDSILADTQQKSDAFRNVITSIRGLEGRKAIIFLTESFSLDPAREMLEYLDSVKSAFEGGQMESPRSEAFRYDDQPMLDAVTSAANAAGITLYPVSARGMSGGINLPSVTENAMPNAVQQKAAGVLPDQALNNLAAATGGLAVTGTNDFLRGFNRIANDLTTYYSLGYRGDSPPKDAVRSVTVKVKKPGFVVRNRENFVQKSAKTEVAQAVSDNLFAVDKSNGMGITVTAGARTAAGNGTVSMPIDITIPISALTLQPQGAELAGKFTVYTAFTRKDGTPSEVKKREYPIHFAAESLKRRESVTVRVNVTMDEATETVSVGVVDQGSTATGFGMVKVTS